jgi:hypothetical protein
MPCPAIVHADGLPLSQTLHVPAYVAPNIPVSFFIVPFTLAIPIPPSPYIWCPGFGVNLTFNVTYDFSIDGFHCLINWVNTAALTLICPEQTPTYDVFGIGYPSCSTGCICGAGAGISISPVYANLCYNSVALAYGLIDGFSYTQPDVVPASGINCDTWPGCIEFYSGTTVQGYFYYAATQFPDIPYTITLNVTDLEFHFSCCTWNQTIDSSALFWGFGSLLWNTPPSAQANPFNYQDAQGNYHETYINDGAVIYRRSDYGTPAGSLWQVDNVNVTPVSSGDSDPRVIKDHRGFLYLHFARSGTGSMESVSYSDGADWSTPVTVISGGTHPTISADEDGTIVRAAYVDGGSGTHGTIKATIQHAGDTSPSSVFTFVDDTETPLDVSNDTFHIMRAYEDASRWVLHVVINGDGATSTWWSADDCSSWTKVT